ncbi:Na+/H+ antiporter MnhB subunit-related protein (plasmid) [Ketogulonicigenium robustum]|uniref:Na+/H+ antiporter MnhB subunit-related protein n=1 Tax=Ketogulonicigenium robustum TaxID=92947 RepID=A0A1W6P3A1_9RHOB|nr:MnhB domain-containing protein [Ketogulonicigenium robustum]ARO15982.1 Na+/H+ antiporter MnhB subunit-related protein [Ketogulonicigenium robustum]
MNSLILRVGARLLTGLFLVVSLYVLLRGHNSPGGGFIGGLIGVAGFVLYSFATDTAQTRAALRADPRRIGVWGMILALVSGAVSGLAGLAPFTGLWLIVHGIALSSVLAFDIGVYLAVFGAILTLVFTLEETS